MAGRTDSYLNLDGLSHQVEKVVEYVGSKIEFVEDSRSGGGSSLVGSCRTMSSLRVGARVLYHSVWGQGSNATLTLTLTDGSQTPTVPIYRHSDIRMGDDYPIGSLIPLVYVSPYVAAGVTVAQAAWVVDADSFPLTYAGSPSKSGNANRSNAILYGTVDATSTATEFTATVEGLTALVDGTTVMLHNGVITSATNFTINVNGLGAKPCYNNLTNATRETTIFNIAYTLMFVYSTSLDSGNGGWWVYRGYDSNTNTIGYQLRTNSSTLLASDKLYRYRILFTSADGTKWVPANLSTSTNATSARTPNTRPIDPLGEIVYYGSTTVVDASESVGVTALWQQYTVSLGYSFNDTGSALTLSYPAPVYVKCTPNADGSAVLVGYSQTLPTRADGYIYIFLGRAYDATSVEMTMRHPVYEWRDGAIREWDNTIATDILTNSEIDALLAGADA